MAAGTNIEWCDDTFNPWTGCSKVSPGCERCYAEAWSKRAGDKVGKWGPGAPRVHTSAANWRQPARWNAQAFVECDNCGWRGEKKSRQACPVCGGGTCKPTRRRVFCASLADVFDNEVPGQWRIELMRLIVDTPNLDWLLLTKRIGNAAGMLETAFRAVHGQRQGWADNVLPNVWIGATIVNQEEADRDITKLLATPAAVRFLSMEPLLGPVKIGRHLYDFVDGTQCIDWVIVGGESGPGARPMHPDWVRNLRQQCDTAGVAFLFKQWGEWAVSKDHPDTLLPVHRYAWANEHGHPADTGFGPFRRELDHHQLMSRIGKKAAGRLLDGVEHNGFPRGDA